MIHHFLQFLQASEDHSNETIESNSNIHSKLLTNSSNNKITVEEAASIIFNNTPTASQLLATHRYIWRNTREYTPIGKDLSQYNESPLIHVHSIQDVEKLKWLKNEYYAINNIKPDQFIKFEPVYDWMRRQPGSCLKSFLETLKSPVNFSECDLFIIECMKKSILVSKSFPSEYKKIIELVFKQDVSKTLVEIGVWSPWTSISIEKSLAEDTIPILNNSMLLKESKRKCDLIASKKTLTQDNLHELRESNKNTVFVIDSSTAHELDDGISIDYISENDYWLNIHIADPTSILDPNDNISLLAKQYSSSLYFPHDDYAMIPSVLTNKFFNLDEGVFALTFSARVDGTGEILDYKVTPTVLSNVRKTTYTNVDEVVYWDSYSDFDKDIDPWVLQTLTAKSHGLNIPKDSKSLYSVFKADSKHDFSIREINDLLKIQEITRKHYKHRLGLGALNQSSPSFNVNCKPYPAPRFVSSQPLLLDFIDHPTVYLDPYASISPAKDLVSESMIIAGRVAAKFCIDHKIPVPYRGQKSLLDVDLTTSSYSLLPNQPKNLNIIESIKLDDILSKRNVKSGLIPYFDFKTLLPFLSPATLDLRPIKHAAMGINGVEVSSNSTSFDEMFGYLKVTSPLRRYSDMIVHWQIKATLLKNSGKSVDHYFTNQDLVEIMPVLVANERAINQLSTKYSELWGKEWCQRREFVNSEILFDKSLGIGLPQVTRKGIKKSESPVYTGMVLNVGKSFTRVLVIELGGIVGNVPFKSEHHEGMIISVSVDRVDLMFNELFLA